MFFSMFHQSNTNFWRFQIAFWLVAFVTLFLSGLSQGMSGEMSLTRNALYALLGFGFSLLFIPLWEFVARRSNPEIVSYLLFYAYGGGLFCTVLVNQYLIFLFELTIEHPRLVYLFGGALNFSLVILVWCGFYLSLKRGLSFEQGAEEQETAKAIASISNLTAYPEYIALERLGKISLLPIAKVSLIKASGDYVEFTCDGDDNSKNETYLKRSW